MKKRIEPLHSPPHRDFCKPKRAKAWACGFCGQLYHDNEHGKEFARLCCTCSTPGCGGIPVRTHGMGRIPCHVCAARKNVESAREHAKAQNEYLKECEEKLARLEGSEEERLKAIGS